MTTSARRLRDVDPVPPPEDGTHRMICRQIKLVMSSLTRRVDSHMQPLELTGMQWEPLMLVWLKRADTVAALARVSQVGVPSMTRMLDRLEQKDLLRRERSELDRRVVNLHLTPKGRKVASKIWPIVVEGMNVHLEGFKKEELNQLNDLLGRMLANGARDAQDN
ncbi:MAG: MarR family transcriptional regulator [Steroidobacteraceae bacterium]|jgi:DNA-binding MarR family transcriptional regulator|nr:MarR family transcriptional regulator [Steroidobacteraceae bacterium]